MCSFGITNYDGGYFYETTSIIVENCDLQSNEVGMKFSHDHSDVLSKGVYVCNTTINGGTMAIDAQLEESLFLGNEITANGANIHGADVRFFGNTFSDGTGLDLTGERLRLENNTFDSNDLGLYVTNCAPILVNNDFTNNQYGVYAEETGQPKLKYNNFEGNSEYGVYNDDSTVWVDAKLNWWDSVDGPGGEGSGDGDAISKYVLYEPWLTEESSHQGHYENIPPDVYPNEPGKKLTFVYNASGSALDPEGDVIRRVEIQIVNGSYDSGWIESDGLWRDVNNRSEFAHILDIFDLGFDGTYNVNARSFDGNDYSKIETIEITVDMPELENHEPINIQSNSGFNAPNSGVGSGSGTPDDPYIIERWEISSEEADAISISNTDEYLIIRLCNIHSERENHGIVLENARNIVIRNNRFHKNQYQINAESNSIFDVIDNMFILGKREIVARDSFVNITGNVFRHSGGPSISMVGEGNGSIVKNLLILSGQNSGISPWGMDPLIAHNVILGSTQINIGDSNATIEYNVLANGDTAININHKQPYFYRNLIVDNYRGVAGSRTTAVMRENNIFGNSEGVRSSNGRIDARWNWWGAANGPSGAGDGDGDLVGDNVDYDPWLTEPCDGEGNHAPTLEITEPDGTGDEADDSYTILWEADDEDGDTVTIDLFYDTD
ncbi:MAG: right-handed parallel beta-helix repeat-containing protein, partial [Thermoplasmata archaeon]|nr:right-handed parallel beta-helix repeat-containing protein [Thermoplasmata archaeon]